MILTAASLRGAKAQRIPSIPFAFKALLSGSRHNFDHLLRVRRPIPADPLLSPWISSGKGQPLPVPHPGQSMTGKEKMSVYDHACISIGGKIVLKCAPWQRHFMRRPSGDKKAPDRCKDQVHLFN